MSAQAEVRTCLKCRRVCDAEAYIALKDGSVFHKHCFTCELCQLELPLKFACKNGKYFHIEVRYLFRYVKLTVDSATRAPRPSHQSVCAVNKQSLAQKSALLLEMIADFTDDVLHAIFVSDHSQSVSKTSAGCSFTKRFVYLDLTD